MVDRSAEHWYPTAAYLYVLHLDDLGTAWEYLRRNPDYRLDWLRHHRRPPKPQQAHRWGLRLLEDPALDARDAHPAWLPAMWPWCSSIPTPIRRSMLPRSRFGALPGTSNCSMTARAGADGAQPRSLPALRAGAWKTGWLSPMPPRQPAATVRSARPWPEAQAGTRRAA